jgi:hypothetical protein
MSARGKPPTDRCGTVDPDSRLGSTCILTTSNPHGHVEHVSLGSRWPEPCRNCGRTDRLRTPIRLDDGSPAFVRCVDALGCRAEQERQDGHAG